MAQSQYGNNPSQQQQDGIPSNNDKTNKDLDEISCRAQVSSNARGIISGETSELLAPGELYQYPSEVRGRVPSACGSATSGSLHPCDSAFVESVCDSSNQVDSAPATELGLVAKSKQQADIIASSRTSGANASNTSGCNQTPSSQLVSNERQQVSLEPSTTQQIRQHTGCLTKEPDESRLGAKRESLGCSGNQRTSASALPHQDASTSDQYANQIDQSMNSFQQQLIFNNNSNSTNNNSATNSSALVDQQQGQPSEAQQQLDLVGEECGGLFVEYQTSRNALGGCLEELNSLNVTNCDSDTLEEQINMLSNDDCFTTTDDLHDFGIGGSSDNFLNMLFMNTGNQTASSLLSVCSTSQNGFQPLNNMSAAPLANLPDNSNSTSHLNQQQQFAIPASAGSDHLGSRAEVVALANSERDQLEPIKRSKAKAGSKNKRSSRGRLSPSRGSSKKDCSERSHECSVDERIATTNNNKRLLPKPKLAGPRRSNKVPPATRVSSPSSMSSAIMSPGSSSHSIDFETPYKVQLDNLRKKLRMDVAPMTATSEPARCSPSDVASGLCNNVNNHLVSQEHHESQTRMTLPPGHQLTSLPGPTAVSTPQNQLLFQTPEISRTNSVQQQQVYMSTQAELGQKIHNSAGACLTIQQPTNNDQAAAGAIGTSAPTAYLIAKPLFEQGFQPSTGGTIYLRTQNGLIPLSAATSDRRAAGLSLMKSTNTGNNLVREQSGLHFVGASSVHQNNALQARQTSFVIQTPSNHVEDHGQVLHLTPDNNLISTESLGQAQQQDQQHLGLHQQALSDPAYSGHHYQSSLQPPMNLQQVQHHQQRRTHQQLTANQILIHNYKDIPIEPSNLGAASKPLVDNRIDVSN